jgi:hypothetical protein
VNDPKRIRGTQTTKTTTTSDKSIFIAENKKKWCELASTFSKK